MTSKNKFFSLRLSILVCILLTAAYYKFHDRFYFPEYVFDEAGILPKADLPRFEKLFALILKENDLDIKFFLVNSVKPKTMEEFATEKMSELHVGGKSAKKTGVLFLYAVDEKKLRIEVGYGLEAYFPDAFVDYLLRGHAEAFFSNNDPSMGLRFLIRILQYRIRSATLGGDFNTDVLENEQSLGYLSGGAGANDIVTKNKNQVPFKKDILPVEIKTALLPQNTVEGTYQIYLVWLRSHHYDPNIALFTPQSIQNLNNFPMTEAYFDYMILLEANKTYKIDQRGNLALLYFTNDPLVSPHLFQKVNGVWLVDIAAEIQNFKDRVGGPFAWDYHGRNNEYARVFRDRFVNIKGYYRVDEGDNREIPMRTQ